MAKSVFTPVQLGNIFLTGESVRIGVNGSGAWQLRGLAGVVVREGRHEGQGELRLGLLPGERGHYRLNFTDAVTGERASTALAVLEPFDLSAVADSPFGVCTHFGQLRGPDTDPDARPKESPDAVPLVRLGGFKTHRDELTWKRTEPVRGTCVFPNAHGRYMSMCAAHAVGSLIILNYNNRHYDGGNTPHTEDGLSGFANYARQIVRRYGAQLSAVEVWNEFNGSFSKGPAAKRPEGYFRILERTYRAVKDEQPDLTVVAPAAVTLPFGWLERLFSLGALEYMDAVSVHPYIYPRQPDTRKDSLDALLVRLDALIRKYNRGEPKPVHLTELGWPTHRGLTGVSGREQARYAVRSSVLALSAGVEKIYWYTLLNTGTDPGKREHNFGLLRHPDDPRGAYTPKPAFVALAVLARQLTGATFVRREGTPDPVYSVLFERAGEPLRVVWVPKRGGQDVSAALDLRAETPLTATDMMGKTVRLEPRGGRVRVELSGSPLYLRGQAALEDPTPLTPKGVFRGLRRLFG